MIINNNNNNNRRQHQYYAVVEIINHYVSVGMVVGWMEGVDYLTGSSEASKIVDISAVLALGKGSVTSSENAHDDVPRLSMGCTLSVERIKGHVHCWSILLP